MSVDQDSKQDWVLGSESALVVFFVESSLGFTVLGTPTLIWSLIWSFGVLGLLASLSVLVVLFVKVSLASSLPGSSVSVWSSWVVALESVLVVLLDNSSVAFAVLGPPRSSVSSFLLLGLLALVDGSSDSVAFTHVGPPPSARSFWKLGPPAACCLFLLGMFLQLDPCVFGQCRLLNHRE